MRTISDTKIFKKVVLHETEQFKIEYVKVKRKSLMDRIRFVKLGNTYTEPQIICIWRYEDEETINSILSLYGYKEGE